MTLARSPLCKELRSILNHADGVSGIPSLDLPELRQALEDLGAYSPPEPFAPAAREALRELVAHLPDIDPDLKNGLLIHFGIAPARISVDGGEVALTALTAAGRREAAWRRAGLTEARYRHDRNGKPQALSRALDQLEQALLGTRAEPAGLSPALARREPHEARFERAWERLDRCRTRSGERAELLAELLALADELADETALEEARALVEFARYELNRGLESYRLVQGVRLLESAIDAYASGRESRVADRLRQQLLNEYMNVFLTGDHVPGGRLTYLGNLEDVAARLLERADAEPLDLARCHVSRAEALKERAMVTHDTDSQRHLYQESRAESEAALHLLEGLTNDDALRISSSAKRHAAVTFELQADKTFDLVERSDTFEMWLRYSEEAAREANGRDDFVRAYALMNAASAHSRLADLETSPVRKGERLAAGREQLADALALLTALADIRGQGWVGIHLCDNLSIQISLESDPQRRIKLLQELETNANLALVHLKQLDDMLGLTLALAQLGKALYLLQAEREPDAASAVGLQNATNVLERALDLARNIGFYREVLSAARYLARCRYDAWRAGGSADAALLVSAIEAQMLGLCELYAGQSAVNELRALYGELDERLQRRLKE